MKKKPKNMISVVAGLLLVIGAFYLSDYKDRLNSEPAKEYSDDYKEEEDEDYEKDELGIEEQDEDYKRDYLGIEDSSEDVDDEETDHEDDSKNETYNDSTVASDNGDISKLSDSPTSAQETNLSLLAQQKFDETYPYKGSKMHEIMGVIEDWSGGGESWLFEVEATIVNSSGAKRDTTLVIEIFPSGPKEGRVTIAEY